MRFIEVATNGTLIGKRISKIYIFEAIIPNQKQRSVTEVIHVFEMVLESLYLLQLYIFWKRVHAFHETYPPRFF